MIQCPCLDDGLCVPAEKRLLQPRVAQSPQQTTQGGRLNLLDDVATDLCLLAKRRIQGAFSRVELQGFDFDLLFNTDQQRLLSPQTYRGSPGLAMVAREDGYEAADESASYPHHTRFAVANI